MAERPTLVDPPIEALLKKVGDSKFTLVAVSALRARDINDYNSSFGSSKRRPTPPQVNILSNKSLSIAMEELYEGKLEFHRPTAEELEVERAQAEVAAAAQAELGAEASLGFAEAEIKGDITALINDLAD